MNSPTASLRSLLGDFRSGVVRGLRVTEENPIEPFVVPELLQHLESQTVTIERDYWGQVIGLADNAQVRLAKIGGLVHRHSPLCVLHAVCLTRLTGSSFFPCLLRLLLQHLRSTAFDISLGITDRFTRKSC